ncbi:hypothetical protein BKA70DRAFT_1494590 [Coprinopsis sp. MPI-PUGE-AT-0042]|nr:hypothetical protein BKA70DRAFT_1494590 [Coprinopsis sp. MPI-PUGE-AT-0042]
MKFTATFAVLAVFVTNVVVISAAPIAPTYDAALEARSDLSEGNLDDVWARFYDGLLDEVEEREYDDDVFESREYDEEIYARAPMKKFVSDVASNLAQNANSYAKQHTQHQNAQIRQGLPRAPFVVAHKASAPSYTSGRTHSTSGKKRSIDIDEEIFERAPMKKFVSDVASGVAQNAHGYAKQHTQHQNAQARQSLPRAPFVQAHKASAPSSGHGKSHSTSGKKRSFLIDEEIFERAPMKKFVSDVASGVAQNAHGYAKQHTQHQNAQIRQGLPRAPFV